MPKRRHNEDYLDRLRRKVRKLQHELYRVCDEREHYSPVSDTNSIRHESEKSPDTDTYRDLAEYPPLYDQADEDSEFLETSHSTGAMDVPETAAAPIDETVAALIAETVAAPVAETAAGPGPEPAAAGSPGLAIAGPSTGKADPTPMAALNKDTELVQDQEAPETLDSSILEILGADPAANVAYGKEIHKEVAIRLEHMATTGISNEVRKEITEKYLVPANCTKIGAPILNAEIKAALTEIVTRRDKGIEMRQKLIASAISAVAIIITKELISKDKDNERLKQLMDVSRILCDVQHSESITRRNFAMYSIKRELKDHVANAKIDRYLFGESLSETLKTAKAVSRSGVDLKVKNQTGPRGFKQPTPSTNSPNYLNWKPRAPARRQQGPQRSREPAQAAVPGPSARYTRAPVHTNSLKTSQPPQRQYRRR